MSDEIAVVDSFCMTDVVRCLAQYVVLNLVCVLAKFDEVCTLVPPLLKMVLINYAQVIFLEHRIAQGQCLTRYFDFLTMFFCCGSLHCVVCSCMFSCQDMSVVH